MFGLSRGRGGKGSNDASEHGEGGASGMNNEGDSFQNRSVPTTFNEMFIFNAAVMGFGGNSWMNEVLSSFDTIVTNVKNSYRLQEECDVLSLRLAKHKGNINFPQYKA